MAGRYVAKSYLIGLSPTQGKAVAEQLAVGLASAAVKAKVRHYDVHRGNVRFHAVQVLGVNVNAKNGVVRHAVSVPTDTDSLTISVGFPVVTLRDTSSEEVRDVVLVAQLTDFGSGGTNQVEPAFSASSFNRQWHFPMHAAKGSSTRQMLELFLALNRDPVTPSATTNNESPRYAKDQTLRNTDYYQAKRLGIALGTLDGAAVLEGTPMGGSFDDVMGRIEDTDAHTDREAIIADLSIVFGAAREEWICEGD